MLNQLDLPIQLMAGDLDTLYLRKLITDIQSSSLDAVVLFAMDHVYSKQGDPLQYKSAFYVPNQLVLSLANKHQELIPAVSIHPARKDALEELDRCIDEGAAMLKLLPNVHFVDYSDKRYFRFWQRMSEAKLPLISHTGSEHTLPVMKAEFADLTYLKYPLEFGVNVIAAHSAAPNAPWDNNGLPALFKMMEQYPNLYADTSAFNTPYRIRFLKSILHSPLIHRFVHGSDYPVPIMPIWAKAWGLLNTSQYLDIKNTANGLERDIKLKRVLGFPDNHFTQIEKILRMPSTSESNLVQQFAIN